MAAALSFVKKLAPKSMDAMVITEVRPFGSMPELARIIQTPHYGACGLRFSECLARDRHESSRTSSPRRFDARHVTVLL